VGFARNVHAIAVGAELPVVVGAAHRAIDEAALRKIRAYVRAVGALHHRPPLGIAIDDDPRAEEITRPTILPAGSSSASISGFQFFR
jgi:hypothetical protein